MTATGQGAVPRDVQVLAALFATSGVGHFAVPRIFESIVPHRLPAKRQLVHISGAVELICAAGLLVPQTRRPAGAGSAALLVAIWPANVQMAADAWHGGSSLRKAVTLVRLPLQMPLIRIALRAARHP